MKINDPHFNNYIVRNANPQQVLLTDSITIWNRSTAKNTKYNWYKCTMSFTFKSRLKVHMKQKQNLNMNKFWWKKHNKSSVLQEILIIETKVANIVDTEQKMSWMGSKMWRIYKYNVQHQPMKPQLKLTKTKRTQIRMKWLWQILK